MNVTIRSATVADLPTLKYFEQGIIQAERPFDETLKPDPISYYDVGYLISVHDAEVAVAEVDGTIIASGFARKKPSLDYVQSDHHAYIGFLYVSPEFRGNRINKILLEHLFNWAEENNLPNIHLTVYPENASAVRAYKKAGFKPHLLEMRLNLEEKNV